MPPAAWQDAVSYSPKMLLATPDSAREHLLPQEPNTSRWARLLLTPSLQDPCPPPSTECCHNISFSGVLALVLNTPHLLLASLCTLFSLAGCIWNEQETLILSWRCKCSWKFLKGEHHFSLPISLLAMHAQHNPEVSLVISFDQPH